MLQRTLRNSRYLIIIAVIGSFLVAVLLSIYAGFLVIRTIIETLIHPNFNLIAGRLLALECIELVDIFLLSTAFYITAAGLYELFVNPAVIMPINLHVRSLEELKAKLLGVIIIVMSVFFLEQVITWDGKRDILSLGISEALVIGVLTLTIKLQTQTHATNTALHE